MRNLLAWLNLLKSYLTAVLRHPLRALSVSMLIYLWSARRRLEKPEFPRWWLAERTPFRKRLWFWIAAPHRLHHGPDYWLYAKLAGRLVMLHPRWLWLRRANHYGVKHSWFGPLHWWGGVSLNDKKLHKGWAWR